MSRPVNLLTLIVLLTVGLAATASAEIPSNYPPCVRQVDEASTLYHSGKIANARVIFERVIEELGKTANSNQPRGEGPVPVVTVCLINAHRRLATLQANGGDHKRGIDHYSKALQYLQPYTQFPDIAAQVYWERGKAYEHQKLYAAATADYSAAIQLDQTHVKSWADRAVSRYYLEQFLDCIDDANRALALDPNLAEMFFVRGSAKLKLKNMSGLIDIQLSARLGNALAQDTLDKGRIEWRK